MVDLSELATAERRQAATVPVSLPLAGAGTISVDVPRADFDRWVEAKRALREAEAVVMRLRDEAAAARGFKT